MTTPNRQPQGIPTGGQFAPDTRSEPTVALTPSVAPVVYKAPLAMDIDLSRVPVEELPEWPEDMGEPHVSFDFNDGKVQTYVTAGDESMVFWDSEFDGTINSTDTGENPWSAFDEQSQKQALAWGKEVHQSIDSATYGIMVEASNKKGVSDLIVAYATGQEAPAGPDLQDKATREAYLFEAEARVSAAKRKLQQVYMIGAAQELREVCPTIDSFELEMGGKRLEIVSAWDADGKPIDDDTIGAASYEVFRYRDEDDFSTFLDGQPITVGEAIDFRPGS